MPKPRSCTQQIAADIRKFGLNAVRDAVEMAVELQAPEPAPRKRAAPKKPAVKAAATADPSTL